VNLAVALSTAALVLATGPRSLEPGYTGQYLYRNDNFRTGQNLAETVLTPSSVNASKFGLQFTDKIDGYAYAEPLYVPAVAIPGDGAHNVVYVATENDSVYAFDADAPGPPLWHSSFINPEANPPITAVPATDIGCGDLVPIIGITATPVIDSTTGTMYVVSKEKLGPGSYRQRLHALDITTGLERSKSPVTITAAAPGTASDGNGTTVPFNPLTQLGRPALTLSNGIVYLAFASHCDIDPFHGWVLGYNETTLAQEVVFNTTPNGTNGGIWQSGCGLGVDTNGDLIAITGDGVFDTGASPQDFGDSFLRLTPNPGATVSMTVASYFTPLNELILDDDDLDMGSGGNLLLPDQPGPNPHLMIGVGKSGSIYLVNRDNMGGFNASQDPMVQEILLYIDGIFSTPAYWRGNVPGVGLQNMVYMIPAGGFPDTFVLSNGLIQTPPAATASNFRFGFPGASPMISANGATGGILWAIDSSAYQTSGSAVLYAFDPTNLNNEFYDSNKFTSDNPGPAVKFSVPTIANGSVYVGTQTQLAVFGLFPAGARPSPTASVSATPSATITSTVTATATPTATPTTSMVVTSPLAFVNVAVGQTVTKAVTVYNTGATHSLVISSATPSDPEYILSGTGTCGTIPVTLAHGTNCTLGIRFAPTAIGAHNASLMLTDNAATSPQTVALTGAGIDGLVLTSDHLTYGSVRFGLTGVGAFAVINYQTQPVTLSESFSGANPSDFSITGGSCTNTLAANTACSLTVTFKPGALGTESATMMVTDSPDPLGPYTVALSTGPTIPDSEPITTMAFGNVVQSSTRTFSFLNVTNSSPFPLTLGETISGPNAADFAVTRVLSCAGNTACAIPVSFTASGETSESATMNIIVSNDPASPHVVALAGTGTTPVLLSPASTLAFGTVTRPNSKAMTITIVNLGVAALTLPTPMLSGANTADFALTTAAAKPCGATLAGGAYCLVGVTFKPSAAVAESASIAISASPDAASPHHISLTGTGM
jgi:hypothetical protein